MIPEQVGQLAAYKDGERPVRAAFGAAWKAITDALALHAAFAAQVERGEFGADVAAYYAAQVAEMDGYDAQARQLLAGGAAVLKAMHNATPGNLFPGIPKDTEPDNAPD